LKKQPKWIRLDEQVLKNELKTYENRDRLRVQDGDDTGDGEELFIFHVVLNIISTLWNITNISC
jgi:hypothetical protein